MSATIRIGYFAHHAEQKAKREKVRTTIGTLNTEYVRIVRQIIYSEKNILVLNVKPRETILKQYTQIETVLNTTIKRVYITESHTTNCVKKDYVLIADEALKNLASMQSVHGVGQKNVRNTRRKCC